MAENTKNALELVKELRDLVDLTTYQYDVVNQAADLIAGLSAADAEEEKTALPENWREELLDWVSACQSAYHIESTPGHRFGGIPGALSENRESLVGYVEELLAAANAEGEKPALTERGAYDMGAKGGPVCENERKLFEAWMRGHCWKIFGKWDGQSYRGTAEHGEHLDPGAMQTRQLWAVWRDRAALAKISAIPAQVEAQGETVNRKLDVLANKPKGNE